MHKVTARITSTDLPDSPSPATESGNLIFNRSIIISTFLTGRNQVEMKDRLFYLIKTACVFYQLQSCSTKEKQEPFV